uniref:Putative LOV domain-containing protein n=1 Tax=Gloriosa superba TaxID=41220 RepID=A0A126WXG5_GLOSU|nr:putative LOV domain-containing protein [Gloriosa superba]
MFPVFSADDGRVVHFVAVQVPIPKRAHSWNNRCLQLNTCRNETLAEADLRCDLALCSLDDTDNGRGLEVEESREAGECERQKAVSAAKDILSMLVHYSKFIGRPVCGKRSSLVVAGVAQISSSLAISLGRIKQSFVLTDPHLPDMPIVYCSDDFLSLTGYTRQEVLGCNCRFLNGSDTDVEVLHQIRDSIRAEQSCTVRLLNYRKDGSSFWNLLHVSPVRNASGKIAFFVGVQIEESSKNVGHGLRPEMLQLGVVASVKVAVRSPSAGAGSSRSS